MAGWLAAANALQLTLQVTLNPAGHALQFADPALRADREVVLAAVSAVGSALRAFNYQPHRRTCCRCCCWQELQRRRRHRRHCRRRRPQTAAAAAAAAAAASAVAA